MALKKKKRNKKVSHRASCPTKLDQWASIDQWGTRSFGCSEKLKSLEAWRLPKMASKILLAHKGHMLCGCLRTVALANFSVSFSITVSLVQAIYWPLQRGLITYSTGSRTQRYLQTLWCMEQYTGKYTPGKDKGCGWTGGLRTERACTSNQEQEREWETITPDVHPLCEL